MTCPFLKEAQVKYCEAAPFRKLIPAARTGRPEEKCSGPAYTECPVYRLHTTPEPQAEGCPYLRESLMQYCGAAPVAKLVPYSESPVVRCAGDSHRYCELYLALAHPHHPSADAIPTPEELSYSANHLWVDVGEDGVCHAGIDAFLARVLGPVEAITYIWQKGRRRAAAVLTAAGTDFEVVFPNPFTLTACNLHLRADPARLTGRPYTEGWLFEGVAEPATLENLIPGPAARGWMDEEQRRMSEFLQQQTGVAADGGLFSSALPRLLGREAMLALFHEFFSPYAGRPATPDARGARKETSH
jgi:glycine cleavage system H lipoate-binding protein